MIAPDLTTPREAIDAARAALERHRYADASDPKRRADLEAAYETLRDCWSLDHRRYMRSGPQTGRVVSDDPVRAVAADRNAEMLRLRRALKPRSGTPRPKPPRVTARGVDGTVGESRALRNYAEAEHARHLRLHGGGQVVAVRGGGYRRSMHALNEEVAPLLEQVEEMRRKLRTTHRRYERQRTNNVAAQDRAAGITERVRDEIRDLGVLAAELRRSTTRTEPLSDAERRAVPRPRRTWPRGDVERLLRSFKAEMGRLPTQRELRTNPTLPHDTTLRRMFGGNWRGRDW